MTRAARVAAGAAAGALVASQAGGTLALGIGLLALGLATVAAARLGRSPADRRVGRLVPVFAGMLLVGVRAALTTPAALPAALPAGSGPWIAIVESVGSPKAGSRPAVIVVDGALVDRALGLKVAATLPWYPEVAAGDRIVVEGSIESPPASAFGDYLRRIGAAGTLRARSLAVDSATAIGPWEAMRRVAAAGLDRAIPQPEAGLAAGIIVGLRDRVDRDLAAAFTTAGVSHIVAISGWNIAIVATTLGALTGRLGRRRRTVATCLAVVAYVAFVGPSPSVVRAAAMAGCALLARELGRPTTAVSAMGLAVTGLLLVDPTYIDDAGFRLSVLATAGLMAWGSGLARWLSGPAPGRARAWLGESLGISLAAQAATLPVILLDFGRLSIVSPAVNLLVAPFVAPAMGAGAVALLAGAMAGAGLPAAVATIGGLPAWLLLGVIVGVVRMGAALPFASVTLDPPVNVAAAAAAAALIASVAGWAGRRSAASWPGGPVRSVLPSSSAPAGSNARGVGHGDGARGERAQRIAAILLAGSTVAVALAFAHRPDGTTRITVLDVGQGDAILVEGSRGGRLLIDGGPDPGRLLIALDEHLPPWDRRLDGIVLTHPHEDHVAGLAALLARYRVGRVFEPGMIGPGPGYAAWDRALTSDDSTTLTRWSLGTGDRLSVDDVDLRVLWPDPGKVPVRPADSGTSINNVSIVLLGEVEGHRFLLAGDIEQGIDATLLARGLPTVDFLKVAHHGSGTASTQAFLDAVHPRIAAVSVGGGNPYGHPAPATIGRLRGIAEQVYRTDLDGSVTVTFNGAATRVRAAGARVATAAATWTASTSPGTARLARPPVSPVVALFACAVPASRTTPTAPPAAGVIAAGRGRTTAALAAPRAALPHPPSSRGNRGSSRYHRPDDGPVQGGGGAAAPVLRSPALARPPFARGLRGRGLVGAPDRAGAPGRPGRSPAGRDGRAPP